MMDGTACAVRVLPFRAPTGAIVTFDADFVYTAVTDEAAAALDTTPEALVGRSCWHAFPDSVESPIGALMRDVMRFRTPAEIRTPTYNRLDTDMIARAVPMADGGIRVLFRFVKRVELSPQGATMAVAVVETLTGTH